MEEREGASWRGERYSRSRCSSLRKAVACCPELLKLRKGDDSENAVYISFLLLL